MTNILGTERFFEPFVLHNIIYIYIYICLEGALTGNTVRAASEAVWADGGLPRNRD